jgi:hypothetical protein
MPNFWPSFARPISRGSDTCSDEKAGGLCPPDPPGIFEARRKGRGVLREASVEAFALLGHIAQECRGGEAGAEFRGQLIAAFCRIRRADDVEPCKRPARPRREAPGEDRAHIAFADILEHAFLERAHRFEHLREHQAMLHFRQIRADPRRAGIAPRARPVALPLALFVIVEEAGLGLAAQPALAFHPEDDLVHGAVGIGIAHRRLRGARDLGAEVDGGFIHQLQRPHGEAQLPRGIVDERGRHALGHHADALVDVGDDAAVAVEEPRVIHHDGRLADLADVIERLGHGARRSVAAP